MSTKKCSHEHSPFILSQALWISFFSKILPCWSISSQSFPNFLNLSGSCQKKAIFAQRHNTSLHSKFRQTQLKLTPKSLDYTQIDTLREPCITDLWFWEVLGQSQRWMRTLQTDLWKLYVNSRIFEFLTPCSKNQTLAHAQKRDCVPLNFKNIIHSGLIYNSILANWHLLWIQ